MKAREDGLEGRILAQLRLSVFIALIGALSCTGASTPSSPTPVALTGTTWTLRTFTDAADRPVAIPQGAIFTIAVNEGRSNVQSDCNRCTGSAALDRRLLDVSLLACTRAFCSSSPVDSQFEKALQARHAVAVDGSSLTLSSSASVLRFSR